jgi:hypothetical protein
MAMPLRRKKKLDPTIARAREEKRKKKLEKALTKMQKKPRIPKYFYQPMKKLLMAKLTFIHPFLGLFLSWNPPLNWYSMLTQIGRG